MILTVFQHLIINIKYAIRRFPLEILFACIGTVAGIISAKTNSSNLELSNWCISIIMTANLGLLVSLSTSLYLESKKITGKYYYLAKCLSALIVLPLIFFFKPTEQDFIRFILLSLAGHLLVSFSAFIKTGTVQGFWQFNEILFIRLFTGILYSIILFLGLSAAIGTTQFLFNVDMGSLAFINLFIFLAGIFNTLFFLAGIPQDLTALNTDFNYPKGLKVFTQYVLIPLASVYLLILLAYEGKILIEWNLPKGLVSSLILGYAVFGILSLLLVYPIREQAENKWIKTYSRSFYFLMLPLLILLFLAVGVRVLNYGVTEYRYFLIVLALWLVLITIYSLLSRKQNIKLIPISLFFFALFSVYGPQSAVSVSAYSQTRILTDIFKKNNAFKNGKMIPVSKISDKDGTRAAQVLRHLVERHGYNVLQPYIQQNLAKAADSLENTVKNNGVKRPNSYQVKTLKIAWLQRQLGLGNFNSYDGAFNFETASSEETYYLKNSQAGLISVSGYDYLWDENSAMEQDTAKNLDIKIERIFKPSGELSLRINSDSTLFNLEELAKDLLKNKSQLSPYKETVSHNAEQQYVLPSKLLRISQESQNYRVTYQINTIRFIRDKNKNIKNFSFTGGVFLIKRLP